MKIAPTTCDKRLMCSMESSCHRKIIIWMNINVGKGKTKKEVITLFEKHEEDESDNNMTDRVVKMYVRRIAAGKNLESSSRRKEIARDSIVSG